jgi:hypothetical protein
MMQSRSQRQEENGTVHPARRGVTPCRVSARIDGDVAVFLIGLRVNRPCKVQTWLPGFLGMPRMPEVPRADPARGSLGMRHLGRLSFVQYWRSFEHIETCARVHDHAHRPAWLALDRAMTDGRGDVGIWHETSLVPAVRHEAVHSGAPHVGLAAAGRIVETAGAHEGS